MIDFSIRNGMEHAICPSLTRPQPELRDDGKRVSKCTVIGKGDSHSILLCGKRQSYFPFHCIVGPDWPVVVLVYFLILAANLIVLPIVAPLGLPVIVIGVVGFLSLLYCYSAVACSDPGIIYEEIEVVDQTAHSPTDPVVQGTIVTLRDSSTGVAGEKDVESLVQKEPNSAEEAGTEDALVVQGELVSSPPVVEHASPSSAPSQRSRQTVHPDRLECGQCELQRPYTARHCHYCGVCIDELDHHCPCEYAEYYY